MSAVRKDERQLAYETSAPKRPQKDVTAYANAHFEATNRLEANQTVQVDKGFTPDFSFARKEVVSSYDDTSYIVNISGFEEDKTFSEMRHSRGRNRSSERFSKWLNEQPLWQSIERGARQEEQIAMRRNDERFVLVEDFGPDGHDTYDYGLYESQDTKAKLQRLVQYEHELLQPTLSAGNLALVPAPADDDFLLKRLKAFETVEEEERQKRQAALKEVESRLSLKRLYKAVGIQRSKKLAVSFLTILSLGMGFIGLMGRQAKIVEANFALANKRSEIRQLTAQNQENYEALMKANDLAQLKEQAMAQLGLREAAQSQRIRIFLPEADRVILYNAEGELSNEEMLTDNYLNYNDLEKYFDGVEGMYE